MFEMPSLFYSILGSPGSGKSHLLATTTWQLRQTLGSRFKLSLTDADPESNRMLNEAEERLFFNETPHSLTAIPKTETEGALYQPVQFGDEKIWYPRPFVFSIQPLRTHPQADNDKLAKSVCLYDNAGEHFLPGGESSISPATQHLTISRGLIFLFDPTQHARYREACQDSEDPQFTATGRSFRQDQILNEAANRIRTQAGLSQREKYQKPLIIVMTKFDSWGPLLCDFELQQPVQDLGDKHSLDLDMIDSISDKMRELMTQYAPEFLNAAEGFAEKVMFIPVSALGVSPEIDDDTGMLGVRPNDVQPCWAEVPLLYLLSRSGLIPSFRRTQG